MLIRNLLRHRSSLFRLSPSAYFGSENDYGVTFDEEQIRRKMEEIKQKKDSPHRPAKEKLEFMSIEGAGEIAKATRKYR